MKKKAKTKEKSTPAKTDSIETKYCLNNSINHFDIGTIEKKIYVIKFYYNRI